MCASAFLVRVRIEHADVLPVTVQPILFLKEPAEHQTVEQGSGEKVALLVWGGTDEYGVTASPVVGKSTGVSYQAPERGEQGAQVTTRVAFIEFCQKNQTRSVCGGGNEPGYGDADLHTTGDLRLQLEGL